MTRDSLSWHSLICKSRQTNYNSKMFKLFVFAAILAFAFAAPEPKPKPGFLTAAYSAPVVAAGAPIAYSAPLVSSYAAAPVVSAYSAPYYSAYPYAAPLVVA